MIFRLVENIATVIPNLSDDDAGFLCSSRLKGAFQVLRLPFSNGYEVTADNIIGALRLPSGDEINIQSKLPLPNIFRMLSYVAELYSPLDEHVGYERDERLFDIIGKVFAFELSSLLKNGLKQLYTPVNGELGTIRGHILFNETIKRQTLQKGKIFCGYWCLSLDHPLNQAVVTAARALLSSDVISVDTKRLLRHSLDRIPTGAIASDFRLEQFAQITLDRTTEYYRRIVFLSRMVLSSLAYSNVSGDNHFAGFLLDVAKLFEKYVAKALIDHEQDGCLVNSQSRVKLDLEGQVECRPDLLFSSEAVPKFVADTKYKDFSNLKFLNQDVYQIITYLVRHRCHHGFLIYPVFKEGRVGILKSITVPTESGELYVHAVCISLEDPGLVAKKIQACLSAAGEASIQISASA